MDLSVIENGERVLARFAWKKVRRFDSSPAPPPATIDGLEEIIRTDRGARDSMETRLR
jgi:hypothetical protein